LKADINASVGIGFRSIHGEDILKTNPKVGWFEIQSENYYYQRGRAWHELLAVAQHYPISLHCVGLSLGSIEGPADSELIALKNLIEKINPILVSAHLCWSSVADVYLHDLLPLPYTDESLQVVTANIIKVQDFINRPLLIENISSYLQFQHSIMAEHEFLSALTKATDCSLLLDITNLYINGFNHGWDPLYYLQQLPQHQVKEIHLAGFSKNSFPMGEILIDTHDTVVAAPVWDLYQTALERFGRVPTLIEWDSQLPEFSILLKEANKIKQHMEQAHVSTC
jgi:uncharacterized protein (UPF0276 family)